MTTIIILITLALMVAIFAIFEDYMAKHKWYIYLILGIFLIFTAATKTVGFDHDSENYEYVFKNYDDSLFQLTFEFSYIFLSRILNLLSDDAHLIFFVYALFGVTAKLYAIKKLSPMLFLPLLIYIGNHYLVMELTQIRAGVAAGFFLLAVYFIIQRQKGIAAGLIICAIIFHYSSVVLIPILFLNNNTLSNKIRLILVSAIPLCYALYFIHFDILTSIPIPYLSSKIEVYTSLTESGVNDMDEINVFNALFMIKIIIFVYLIYYYELVREHNENISILLLLEGFSIYSFILFSNIPTLSFRLSDLFGIVDIALIPNIYYTIKQEIPAKTAVVSVGFIFLFMNLFYIKLFDF